MNDLVLITSVINTGKHQWTYSRIRSVFTPEERFEQTLATIESVRKHLPKAHILMVECSALSQPMTETLQSKVDYFLNVINNEEAVEACLQTNKKGWGEAVQTKLALEFIMKKQIQFQRLFKLSGRYTLNEEFREEIFPFDAYVFKKGLISSTGVYAIFTVLFSVPFSLLQQFYKNILVATQYYPDGESKSYEEIVPPLCNPKIELDKLGVSGIVAVDRTHQFRG